MKKIKKETKISFLIFMIFIIFIVMLYKYINPIYYTSDDIAYKNILSGALTGTPDAHTYFILYPLSFILMIFYTVFSKIEWYGLFLLLANIMPIYFVLRTILREKKGNILFNIGLISLVFVFLHFKNMVKLEWTVTATILIVCSYICIFSSIRYEKKTLNLSSIAGYIMLFLSMNLRSYIFYLSIPLLLFYYLYFINDHKILTLTMVKKNVKKFFPILIIGFIFILSIGTHKIAYGSSEWKDYISYTNYRSQIRDYYGFPDYYEYEKEYNEMGIDTIKYSLLADQYNVVYTDNSISIETYQQLAELAKKNYSERHSFTDRIILTFRNAYKNFTSSQYFNYNIVFFTLITLSTILLLSKKKYFLILLSYGITGIYLIAWYYFQFKNRLPERIGASILLMMIAIYFMILMKEYKVKASTHKNYISLLPLTCLLISNSILISWDMEDRRLSYQDREFLYEYYETNSDHIYLKDFNSFNNMSEQLNITSNNSSVNEVALGGWNVKTPTYQKQLERLGLTGIADLLNQDELYYIADNSIIGYELPAISEYYIENDIDVSIDMVDEFMLPSGKVMQVYTIVRI